MDTSVDWDSFFQFVNPNMLSPVIVPQEPTPPQSDEESPPVPGPSFSPAGAESEDEVVLSISSTFFPRANLHALDPDLILLSMDHVFFYVHSHLLLNRSMNKFGSLLPRNPQHNPHNISHLHPSTTNSTTISEIDWANQHHPVLRMPHHSAVLNIILHAIYDLSCIHYSPPIDTLITAVEEMPNLGLPLKLHISAGTSLYSQLLSLAPLHPLKIYALAGHYDLYELAVPVSSHLLSYCFSQLEDSMAERMGATYLKRLFFLHSGRMEALKRMLLQLPRPHAPTSYCDFEEQGNVTRAWALASASLAWDARPDLSTSVMESALDPLMQHLTCRLCKVTMENRVRDLIVQWSLIKRTI